MSNKTANFQELLRAAKGNITKSSLTNIPEIEWGCIKRELLAKDPGISDSDVELAMQEAILDAEANLVLFQTQYGKLSTASHYSFPLVFNMTANTPEARGRTHVVRPFWLGKGNSYKLSHYKYKEAKSPEVVESFISNLLVDQIVEMALMYAHNPETTPEVKKIHARETGKEVERRWYREQFDSGFSLSKYTYPLIINLAEWINADFPKDWEFVHIPESAEFEQWTGTVLTASEYKQVIQKLKSKDYENPMQLAKLLEDKTAISLSDQVALLQAQLAEKDRLLNEKPKTK